MNKSETGDLTPQQMALINRKLLEAEIVSRAWSDDGFRDCLEADPSKTLAADGYPVPENKTISVISDEESMLIVLPCKPSSSDEASDDELAAVAGGGLIDNGKCELHENSKTDTGARFALGIGAIVGASWFWG